MKRLLPVLAAGLLAVFSRAATAEPALVVADNHMRMGPGLGYPIIVTVVEGSTVNVHRCRGVWCEVRIRGRRGFVNVRRLDFAAYAPSRRVERADHRAGRTSRIEHTSNVSRGARELAPRREAAPPWKKIPAAEMPRGPLPPPPVIDPPPTVPSITPKPLPSQVPEKAPFKIPEGAPEISL